ncbi:MAG: prepilin-type N-terminal cleavage/methylation domain-containing protein [Chthoniobacter sp.]
MLIGMVLILLAVPSVAGLFAEQRLHESFARFEQLANTARWRSIKEQQPYRLVWDKHRIVLQAVTPAAGESGEVESLTLSDDESFQLVRTAALLSPAPDEWTFWPNGVSEPVVVNYHGHSGRWQVRFDAFNPRGTFQQSEAPVTARSNRDPHASRRGFALLEAMLAVAIFALGILSLGRCISQGLKVGACGGRRPPAPIAFWRTVPPRSRLERCRRRRRRSRSMGSTEG